ncbi:hypothetical protein RQP53_19020 [Paucibacter sp. APW11]|uniref:Uncharacterized protein n=1 Tax=Roseateles aquae TaxID=3077235 RepID=A0ABU3PFM2_9BURK|nr:hypothetical protein [Paucibacter sp. APW11]MDT9001380.1 hypothetical protein [Paucibacter sp. APW11]
MSHKSHRSRPITAMAFGLALIFAPMVPAQASEVVKLARLVLTGKRTSEPAQAPQPKPGPGNHDSAERGPRSLHLSDAGKFEISAEGELSLHSRALLPRS